MLEFQSQIHFKKVQSWLEERFDSARDDNKH